MAGFVDINSRLQGAAPPTPRRSSVMDNFDAANRDLGMTPQEQDLYKRHLKNLYGPGGVDNPDGSRSTLYQMSTEINGRTYNLPTVYDGKKVSPDEAAARADAQGIDTFPSYASEEEAEKRYDDMHKYMDQDTGRFMAIKSAATASATIAAFSGTGETY